MAASHSSVDVMLPAGRHSKLPQTVESMRPPAYSWLFTPRRCDPPSRISAGDGRREGAAPRNQGCLCGQNSVQAQHAGGRQPVGLHYPGAHTAAAQLTATSIQKSATSKTLSQQMLFGSIKSCSCWVDCQRLLHANAEQLDAMLLSTLVTQTVYVHQNSSKEQQDAADGEHRTTTNTAGIASGHQQQQQPEALSIHSPVSPRTTAKRARHSSKSNRGNSKVAFSNYLHQLAQVSLLLIMAFRPQQFSNVLWGLAKCGFAPSGGFIDRYLSQAELQLVNFHPRHLAQLIWALAVMQAKPSRTFLANFLAESSDKLSLFNPQDIANTLWALATLKTQPPMDWLFTALSAAEPQWVQFKPQELSITIWAFARLGMTWRPQPASPGLSLGGNGLSVEGLAQLLMAVQGVMPSMSPQEVCNVLWGLVVGRADLAPQQVQFLAMHALRVLYLNQLNSSRCSGGGSISRDLCSCMWSLTKLRWTPSTQQAELPIRLIHQQQQLWTLHPGSSCREAATLLWCFGKLRIRPPTETMQLLLLQMQQGIASPSATAADAVQALSGCRALQWRPNRAWWARFYQDSLGVLQDASVVEVSRVLAYAAGVKPLQPTKEWWEAVWRKVGRSAYVTLAANGLKPRVTSAGAGTIHRTFDRDMATCSSSVGTSGGSRGPAHLAPTAARGLTPHTRRSQRQRILLSSISNNTQASALEQQEQEQLQRRAEGWNLSSLLASSVGPWHEIHQTMQQLTRLRATAAVAAQYGGASGTGQSSGLTRFDLLNPQSTVMLLWSCARLRRLPFKGVLWQLLLLVLIQLHNYTPEQLTGVMWSVSMLFERYDMHMMHCRRVSKLLVVGAQWRFHTSMAGEGVVQKNYVSALRFLARALRLQRLLRLKYRSKIGL